MAKIKPNPIFQELSGSLGKDLMFRRLRDGRTILCQKPDFSNRKFSNEQLSHQQRFRQAAAYAKQAAKTNPIYAELAAGTVKNAYNIALSDWFNSPEILEGDVGNWIDESGGVLRVQVRDDVLVSEVSVVITDETESVIEHGQATQANQFWWEYSTEEAIVGKHQLIVIAKDLAGNTTEWNDWR